MFTELLPVLQDRMVTLIIARLDETLLRVIVVPQRKSDKENNAAENALSTPLTVTGTAEELDRELARQMRSFSGSYERAACNIREIENAHAAAVKAADEEKKNAKGKKPSAPPVKAATRAEGDSTAPVNGKPVFGSKTQNASVPAMQSLFDPPPAEEDEHAETVKPKNRAETEPVQDPAAPVVTVTETAATAALVADSVGRENNPQAEQKASSGEEACHICECPILPSQKR